MDRRDDLDGMKRFMMGYDGMGYDGMGWDEMALERYPRDTPM